MKLVTAFRSELLKTKRTASFYFTLGGAAPVPLLFMLNVLTGGGDVEAVHKGTINNVFELGMERAGMVFFPLFVILICTLLPQIEYRNNTWKQVFASPQSKRNIFVAKFLNINALLALFLAATLVYMTIAIVVMHFANPARHLLSQPFDFAKLLVQTGSIYITMLAICSIQFWLGLRFRNFVIPTAIGLCLWITGMMLSVESGSVFVEYFPYSIQTFPFLQKFQPKLAQAAWISAGYSMVILVLGFVDFRRRRLTA